MAFPHLNILVIVMFTAFGFSSATYICLSPTGTSDPIIDPNSCALTASPSLYVTPDTPADTDTCMTYFDLKVVDKFGNLYSLQKEPTTLGLIATAYTTLVLASVDPLALPSTTENSPSSAVLAYANTLTPDTVADTSFRAAAIFSPYDNTISFVLSRTTSCNGVLTPVLDYVEYSVNLDSENFCSNIILTTSPCSSGCTSFKPTSKKALGVCPVVPNPKPNANKIMAAVTISGSATGGGVKAYSCVWVINHWVC